MKVYRQTSTSKSATGPITVATPSAMNAAISKTRSTPDISLIPSSPPALTGRPTRDILSGVRPHPPLFFHRLNLEYFVQRRVLRPPPAPVQNGASRSTIAIRARRSGARSCRSGRPGAGAPRPSAARAAGPRRGHCARWCGRRGPAPATLDRRRRPSARPNTAKRRRWRDRHGLPDLDQLGQALRLVLRQRPQAKPFHTAAASSASRTFGVLGRARLICSANILNPSWGCFRRKRSRSGKPEFPVDSLSGAMRPSRPSGGESPYRFQRRCPLPGVAPFSFYVLFGLAFSASRRRNHPSTATGHHAQNDGRCQTLAGAREQRRWWRSVLLIISDCLQAAF